MRKIRPATSLIALLLVCAILFSIMLPTSSVLSADEEVAEIDYTAYIGAKIVEVYGTDYDPTVFELYTEPNGEFGNFIVNISGYDAEDNYYDNVNIAEAFDMYVSNVQADADGVLWFYFEVSKEIKDTADGEPYPVEFSGWVKADAVKLDRVVNAAGNTTIAVSGNVPADVTLSAKNVEINPADYGISDATNVSAALDIKLLDANGDAYQPSADGKKVTLTLDASSWGLEDGDVVNIHHNHGDKVTVMKHYLILGGKLTFTVSDFSIFVVENVGDEAGEPVEDESIYTMTAGQPAKIFYWDFVEYDEETDGRWPFLPVYTTNYTSGPCVWHVSDLDGAISFTVHETQLDNFQHYAPYIEITPIKEGTATITMDYIEIGDPSNSNINTQEVKSVSFTIQVVAPTAFYIADQVAESGCLVPTWPEGTQPEGNMTYDWTRSDNEPIRAEALNADGSVNISKDRGGVTNSREPLIYTVTATDENGRVYQAQYMVLYGNEILNPSFETPVAPEKDINGAQCDANATFFNGYPGLYWKTTAPALPSTNPDFETGQLTKDIEIIHPGIGQNHHGVAQAADGAQYAEVNAEAFGTLYQDILTTPGAEFTWNFSHAARPGGQNTIYVVVAGTEYAQNVTNYQTIDAILDAVRNQNIPVNGEGYEHTDANGNKYRIWRHTATEDPVWSQISGTYTIPEGQYLTRLFFASETAGNENGSTMGNLIDAVSGGEQMRYKIEYYVDGELAKTQQGPATVYTNVPLTALLDYTDYVVTEVKVNGASYPGDYKEGLYISDYGPSNDDEYAIVMQVHLKQKAITVTKRVVIEGWTEMSQTQKDDLNALFANGYTAEFGLFVDEAQVATAQVYITNIPEDGQIVAICEFNKTPGGAQFVPSEDVYYTVKEISATSLTGYSCKPTYSNERVTLTKASLTASVTVTNTYARGYTELTIVKTGAAESLDPDQTFIFNVSGNGVDLDVTIHGNSSVTITGLEVDKTYTVTEKTDWSWRYEPTDVDNKIEIILSADADDNKLTFENTRNIPWWLDGNTFDVNIFNGKSHQTVAEEGSENE